MTIGDRTSVTCSVEQEATGRIEALAGRLETEKARRKEATKEANQAREARSAPPCWASLGGIP